MEEFTPMIHHIIKSLHIYKDVDEYFQLGLIALWEATKKYEPQLGSFSGLAYSMIRFKMIGKLKIENRNRNQLTCLTSMDIIDEHAETPLELESLLSYCDGLTVNQLNLIKASFLECKKLREIAEDEEISIAAVKSRKKTALQKIRANIKV